MNTNLQESVIFAGGCFWCTEAIFRRLRGVTEVVSGYCGGDTTDPTYEQVTTGQTGHAEAVRITFNSRDISFQQLLEVFFATHDPTSLNQQGHDRGTQYRSEIFYNTEDQRQLALDYITKHNLTETQQPIVTKVSPTSTFYPAETYHWNYYDSNRQQSYCQLVIAPKLEVLEHKFKPFLLHA